VILIREHILSAKTTCGSTTAQYEGREVTGKVDTVLLARQRHSRGRTSSAQEAHGRRFLSQEKAAKLMGNNIYIVVA
jgi:hypothetical protein